MHRNKPLKSLASGVGRLRDQRGFTLVELLLVASLFGITMGMFAVTFGTVVNRSSEVSDQNILQTEVRSSLDSMVEDFRSAAPPDESTQAIVSYSQNAIEFYAPDRLAPNRMRRLSYYLQGSDCGTEPCTLMRQSTMSTNSNGPPWDWPTTPGPEEIVVQEVTAPAIAAQPGAPSSAWSGGQIFKYCGPISEDIPSDMAPLASSQAPDPITWTCTTPTSVGNIVTIVVRVAMSANPRSQKYTYGSVATLRWNAS
jgi:prepilin-type N-terminal cleavage/methylation domain-containing protein